MRKNMFFSKLQASLLGAVCLSAAALLLQPEQPFAAPYSVPVLAPQPSGETPVFRNGWQYDSTQTYANRSKPVRTDKNIRHYEQKDAVTETVTETAERNKVNLNRGRDGLQAGGVTMRPKDNIVLGIGVPAYADKRNGASKCSNLQLQYEF